MKNIYYDTEACGLAQVGCLEESGLSYEYNTFLVVEEIQSKKMYWVTDSGCSCPTPFENYHFTSVEDNDLNVLNKETFEAFIREVKTFPVSTDERQSLIRKVKYRLDKQ